MTLNQRALIIDCSPGNGTGNTLVTELNTAKDQTIRFSFKVIHDRSLEVLNDLKSGQRFDLIFLAPPADDESFNETFFNLIHDNHIHLPVFVLPEKCDSKYMIRLINMGAMDVFVRPLKKALLLPRLWIHLRPRNRFEQMRRNLRIKLGLKQIIGQNDRFLNEIEKIPVIAKCDANVLIAGETGTGKELCARAVHYMSPRARNAFIPVNCGAIPDELVESELFGHVRGAFTGAGSDKTGLIQEGDHGTLLLDEIDCLKPSAQVKLLRFLQDKEYRPVGSTKLFRSDIRIIAATNIDLKSAVESGKLRQDLYYRLDVIPMSLPPLRERMDDLATLARHFLEKANLKFRKKIVDFTPEAFHKFLLYDWPGNVRELGHVIDRAVLFSHAEVIQMDDVIFPRITSPPDHLSFKEAKARIVDGFEKNYIRGLLTSYQGNISRAAQAAQKNRRAFWELMRKHDIDAHSFRPGQ